MLKIETMNGGVAYIDPESVVAIDQVTEYSSPSYTLIDEFIVMIKNQPMAITIPSSEVQKVVDAVDSFNKRHNTKIEGASLESVTSAIDIVNCLKERLENKQ